MVGRRFANFPACKVVVIVTRERYYVSDSVPIRRGPFPRALFVRVASGAVKYRRHGRHGRFDRRVNVVEEAARSRLTSGNRVNAHVRRRRYVTEISVSEILTRARERRVAKPGDRVTFRPHPRSLIRRPSRVSPTTGSVENIICQCKVSRTRKGTVEHSTGSSKRISLQVTTRVRYSPSALRVGLIIVTFNI